MTIMRTSTPRSMQRAIIRSIRRTRTQSMQRNMPQMSTQTTWTTLQSTPQSGLQYTSLAHVWCPTCATAEQLVFRRSVAVVRVVHCSCCCWDLGWGMGFPHLSTIPHEARRRITPFVPVPCVFHVLKIVNVFVLFLFALLLESSHIFKSAYLRMCIALSSLPNHNSA